METLLHWILGMFIALVLYILLSGAAFVTVYRFPGVAPTKFYGRFFGPLDWIARRVPVFRTAYNGFHHWCYRTFVQNH